MAKEINWDNTLDSMNMQECIDNIVPGGTIRVDVLTDENGNEKRRFAITLDGKIAAKFDYDNVRFTAIGSVSARVADEWMSGNKEPELYEIHLVGDDLQNSALKLRRAATVDVSNWTA